MDVDRAAVMLTFFLTVHQRDREKETEGGGRGGGVVFEYEPECG